MAANIINPLNNDVWYVKYIGPWNSPRAKFQCNGNAFYLVITAKNDLTWSLIHISGVSRIRLKKVTAIASSGLVEAKVEDNVWGPLLCNYSNLPLKHPPVEIQFVLEFEETSPPLRKTQGEAQHLVNLSKLLGSGAMADVLFDVKGQQMAAHLAILAAGSPVFAAMIQQQLQEGARSVKISNMEPEVFQQLLHYLYTGVAPRLNEMAEQLFRAAEKCQMPQLMEQCANVWIENLSMENVVRCLVKAHLHSSSKMLEGCVRFIAARAEHRRLIWNQPDWRRLNECYPEFFMKVCEKLTIAVNDDIVAAAYVVKS